ncbi:MAG: RND transporter, partial [Lentisphaerae bacterium]|nr:RND transporter [Lentisphaerota bacterium]
MRNPRPSPLLALLAAALLCLAGCASFDADQTRRDQTQAFRALLDRQARELLAHPLSLDACIRLAMTNNY